MEASSSESLTRTLKVKNEMGIHARPAAMIVRVANRYETVDLWVEKDGDQVNGKSIMGLMMLAAGNGSQLTFIASGDNANEMLDEMADLFDRRFEEA
ncbi:MAG: HPr family phosphocarrier protein [Opitutales bacterium]